MHRFWKFVTNSQSRTLHLDGYIAEQSWYEDDVTPKAFKAELYTDTEDVVVRINSPGGDCFAAAELYNMLKEYPGKVRVEIDSLAASAASVVAMAGDEVCISPLGIVMIHNPATIAIGEERDLKAAVELLQEVKESIMNAYAKKTKLSRTKLSHMMDKETWMSAHKAIELGFVDSLTQPQEAVPQDFLFDKATTMKNMVAKMRSKTPISQLHKRLDLIKPKGGMPNE